MTTNNDFLEVAKLMTKREKKKEKKRFADKIEN